MIKSKEQIENEKTQRIQVIAIALFVILCTSTFPNFLPIIWMNNDFFPILIKQGLNYIVLPVFLLLISDSILRTPNKDSDHIKRWVSSCLIGSFLFIIFVLFSLHVNFDAKIAGCSTQNSTINEKQCIHEVTISRFYFFKI